MTHLVYSFIKTWVIPAIIGIGYCVVPPATTFAAEDQYKIPGWACKPAGKSGGTAFLHAKYQSRGRIYNTHTSITIKVVCPLHIKEGVNRFKKVLIYYTNNHSQRSVECTLNVDWRGRNSGYKGQSPLGPRQGYFPISVAHRTIGSSHFLSCRIPSKTTAGFSSIDSIHVYLNKPDNPGGVVNANLPALACHPLSESLRNQYDNDFTDGKLVNLHRTGPLQVVCPLVRDNTKTTQSPWIQVFMENRNPNARFPASCTTWVTSSSQRKSARMRWDDPDKDGTGRFVTYRKVAINSNDAISVVCTIPSKSASGISSWMQMIEYSE